MDNLQVVDWYFLKHDSEGPDETAQIAAIEAQRSGKLIFTRFDGDRTVDHDPVPLLLDALMTGKDREGALAAARQAHNQWWAMDCTDREYGQEELMELMNQRAFVLTAVATVHVWNRDFTVADRIQPEFLPNSNLWSGHRREVMELYLVHLIFHKEYGRVEAIFQDPDFKEAFLDYYDLYRSVLDPHYEFQSKQGPFLATVNKVNQYCRQTGRKVLFGAV
jgi:hypothetical protein